jgi:hypothetical protein
MANKKSKYKKITPTLKQKLKILYTQGDQDEQGIRTIYTIEELAKDNKLSKNTLYKLAQRENWKFEQEKFQKQYEERLENQRIQEFAKEAKKFDSVSLNIAKALLARVGSIIREAQNTSIKEFTPQQMDALARAALNTQKFAKLALGESTDNININGKIEQQETFARAMELLDHIENSRSRSSKNTH